MIIFNEILWQTKTEKMTPKLILYLGILLSFILTPKAIDVGGDPKKSYNHGEYGGTKGSFPENAYGAKPHHQPGNMDWDNSPSESKDVMNQIWTGIRHNQHKKHQSTCANLKFVPNWPDPSKQLGQVAAVGIDKNGNVLVFHRGDRVWGSQTFTYDNLYNNRELGPIEQNTIVTFNATSGLVEGEWGSNMFYLPHGLTVDFENNIWVTDVALHQVFKFSAVRNANDKPLLSLGEPFVPGNDDNHFCKPTDVAILSNGDFFVSDGYCNSRIVKFDKAGKKLMEWGRSTLSSVAVLVGEKPPPDHFLVPHALAVDEDNSILFVADRENGRVQCFNTSTGVFIRQLHSHIIGPRIFSVAFAPVQGGLLYIVNGPVYGNSSLKVDGFVVSLASEEFIAHFNTNGSGFRNPHDVAVKHDGSEVYVVELDPFKVWKFVRGNLNISIPVYPPKTENASVVDNTTTSSQAPSYHPKIGDVADAASASSTLPKIPSKGSVIATAVAIASVIIVLIIALTVIILRIRRGCISRYYSHHPSRWDFHMPSTEGFKLGKFLDRHQGFEKVSTEESDDEGAGGSANECQQTAPFA